uniref:Retinal Dehydrogenase A (RDH-A) n=1 Tax=Leptochiton asellus TaxID=211853 RepID=A0A8D8EK19_9MOLL|nr:Retinal Dehydrogenase A (RDH-A) [Leptochiton asellus]
MAWLWIVIVCVVLYYVLMLIRHKLSVGGYQDRHVLITGCDTGFGHLLALRLDEMGFRVFAGCLTDKGEDELRKNASKALHAFHFDVTQDMSLQNALKHVTNNIPPGKGLWGIVNNAGIAGPGFLAPLEWLTKEDYEKTLAVNLFGPIETTRVFLPLIRKEKGRVVIMSSIAGIINIPTECAYAVSKHALESYADTLRMSVRMYEVSVHTIRPSGFATTFQNKEAIEANVKSIWRRLDPERRTFYGEQYFDGLLLLRRRLSAMFTRDPRPSKVVDTYVHALTARYPKTHYRVGWGANTTVRIIAWLPDGVRDWLWASIIPRPVGA